MRMKRLIIAPAAAALAAVAVACLAFPNWGRTLQVDPGASLVTTEIQADIERYIAEEARRGNGYFRFSSDGKDYLFKLVRVHTEYLARLSDEARFACVDLVDTAGDVYDVDFFLSGRPGSMVVTETTLHKLNGIPFYVWQQDKDKNWKRAAVDKASPQSLGIITGEDAFDFRYEVKLPELAGAARMWLPLPASDAFQQVEVQATHWAGEHRILEEPEHGNKALFFELAAQDSGKTVAIDYRVHRLEKAAYAAKPADAQQSLQPDRLVPFNEEFDRTAREVTAGKEGHLVQARALYDHVIDRMRYMKYGPGWGKGDAVYACNLRTGNCTDYHAYFIGLARAAGIPARFAIGAAIPSERDEGGIDGYHCWVEFYAMDKWWPVDISEADKYSSLSTYYFGHHPANRFELSRGRDLVFTPAPESGPINFLANPMLEIDGKPVKLTAVFSFNRQTAQQQHTAQLASAP
jgi:transglutaminase-like putative cysteine protease